MAYLHYDVMCLPASLHRGLKSVSYVVHWNEEDKSGMLKSAPAQV